MSISLVKKRKVRTLKRLLYASIYLRIHAFIIRGQKKYFLRSKATLPYSLINLRTKRFKSHNLDTILLIIRRFNHQIRHRRAKITTDVTAVTANYSVRPLARPCPSRQRFLCSITKGGPLSKMSPTGSSWLRIPTSASRLALQRAQISSQNDSISNSNS